MISFLASLLIASLLITRKAPARSNSDAKGNDIMGDRVRAIASHKRYAKGTRRERHSPCIVLLSLVAVLARGGRFLSAFDQRLFDNDMD